jgi:hypothetical protein
MNYRVQKNCRRLTNRDRHFHRVKNIVGIQLPFQNCSVISWQLRMGADKSLGFERNLISSRSFCSSQGGQFLFLFLLSLEHGASMKLSVSLQFLNLGQSVGLLGRVISSTQDLYLHRAHKHRINVHIHINIHASSRIRTYDSGIRASQDSSWLRTLGDRDRHKASITHQKLADLHFEV